MAGASGSMLPWGRGGERRGEVGGGESGRERGGSKREGKRRREGEELHNLHKQLPVMVKLK